MNVKEQSFNAPRAVATTVSVSTSTAQSAALPAGDYVFVCSQACNVLAGANPTATTSCMFIPANTMVRICGIQDNEKLAVIAAASGTAWLQAI